MHTVPERVLPDIQDEVDERGIALNSVGVAGVRTPVRLSDGEIDVSGVADVDVTVALDCHRRGIHMSRMIELVGEHLSYFDPRQISLTLELFARRLDTQSVNLALALPVPMQVTAPVSGITSWQVSDIRFDAARTPSGVELVTAVTTHVTSLCPCSKAISEYGAHNQRSSVTLSIVGNSSAPYPLSIAEMIGLARAGGSAPIYPVIKRPDERWVTMEAYDHPVFVEDMARDLSIVCRERQLSHAIRVRNFESIHSHDAIASVAWEVDSDAHA